jgi:hypothetical protein
VRRAQSVQNYSSRGTKKITLRPIMSCDSFAARPQRVKYYPRLRWLNVRRLTARISPAINGKLLIGSSPDRGEHQAGDT